MADTHFTWPVYEIENFLLEPEILREAAKTLIGHDPFAPNQDVVDILRGVGGEIALKLAADEVQTALNEEFVHSLSIGASSVNAASDLKNSAEASQRRVTGIDVSSVRIDEMLAEANAKFAKSLQSEDFLKRFPGDRLIRALAGKLGINGDHFRNVCLDQAQRLGRRPQGMEETLAKALT